MDQPPSMRYTELVTIAASSDARNVDLEGTLKRKGGFKADERIFATKQLIVVHNSMHCEQASVSTVYGRSGRGKTRIAKLCHGAARQTRRDPQHAR